LAKFMVQASYSAEGLNGLIKDSAKAREAAVGKMLSAAGGKLEAIYWSLGDADGYVVCDLPDNVTAAAVALMVSASGAVRTKTTALFTAAEMDQAIGQGVTYRAPGAKGKKK
jgi:uncharacterized protein with GYD domain